MSCFATSRRFIRVQRRQQIEYAHGGEEPCSVVAIGARNVRAVRFERSCDPIKATGAQVRDVSERIESVIAARSEKVARIPAPTHTSTPTVRKQITARPHIFSRAWPKPGTSQPPRPTTRASASRLEFCG